MKINTYTIKTGLILASLCLTALRSSAVPLTVSDYSTTLAAGTNNTYKDSIYSGSAVTAGSLITYTGGTGKLTDGVTTGSTAWVGWYGEPGWPTSLQHPTMVFDFGSTANFDDVSLYFWQYTPNLIRLPTALHVQYSNDGSTYGSAENFSIASGSIPNGTTGWITFSLSGSGRYARLELDNLSRDTFISEVKFQGAMAPATVPDSASTVLCLGLALGGCVALRGIKQRKFEGHGRIPAIDESACEPMDAK